MLYLCLEDIVESDSLIFDQVLKLEVHGICLCVIVFWHGRLSTTWGMCVTTVMIMMMLMMWIGDEASLGGIVLREQLIALVLWIDIQGERCVNIQIFMLGNELLGDLGNHGLAWPITRAIVRLRHWKGIIDRNLLLILRLQRLIRHLGQLWLGWVIWLKWLECLFRQLRLL